MAKRKSEYLSIPIEDDEPVLPEVASVTVVLDTGKGQCEYRKVSVRRQPTPDDAATLSYVYATMCELMRSNRPYEGFPLLEVIYTKESQHANERKASKRA